MSSGIHSCQTETFIRHGVTHEGYRQDETYNNRFLLTCLYLSLHIKRRMASKHDTELVDATQDHGAREPNSPSSTCRPDLQNLLVLLVDGQVVDGGDDAVENTWLGNSIVALDRHLLGPQQFTQPFQTPGLSQKILKHQSHQMRKRRTTSMAPGLALHACTSDYNLWFQFQIFKTGKGSAPNTIFKNFTQEM